MVEVDCDYCGSTINRNPCDLRRNERTYCNSECMYADRREDRHEVECAHCGEALTRRTGRLKNQDNHYCGPECQAADLNQQIEVECAECGTTLQRQPHHVERSERHFCDIECKGAWQSKHCIGERAPYWTGGSDSYQGPRWRHHRAKIIDRDNHECTLCGISEATHRQLFGKGLSVHHVTPRQECESWTEANSPGNLLTVCMVCHGSVFDAGYYTPGGRPMRSTT